MAGQERRCHSPHPLPRCPPSCCLAVPTFSGLEAPARPLLPPPHPVLCPGNLQSKGVVCSLALGPCGGHIARVKKFGISSLRACHVPAPGCEKDPVLAGRGAASRRDSWRVLSQILIALLLSLPTARNKSETQEAPEFGATRSAVPSQKIWSCSRYRHLSVFLITGRDVARLANPALILYFVPSEA